MKTKGEFLSHLMEIIKIPAMSKKEYIMIKYLKNKYPEFQMDDHGNLFILRENTPIVSAHTDTVGSLAAQGVLQYADYNPHADIIIGMGNLGADDKVGIAISTLLYEEFGDAVSILLFVEEEIGLIGSRKFVEANRNKLRENNFYLVFDRKNPNDFICTNNSYGSPEFEKRALEFIGDDTPFKFKSATGSSSDANNLCDVLSGANMSCGYYNAHTDNEYIVLGEAYNSYLAGRELIIKMGSDKFAAPEKKTNIYGAYGNRYYAGGYGGGYGGYNKWDSDDYYKKNKIPVCDKEENNSFIEDWSDAPFPTTKKKDTEAITQQKKFICPTCKSSEFIEDANSKTRECDFCGTTENYYDTSEKFDYFQELNDELGVIFYEIQQKERLYDLKKNPTKEEINIFLKELKDISFDLEYFESDFELLEESDMKNLLIESYIKTKEKLDQVKKKFLSGTKQTKKKKEISKFFF